MQYNGKIDLNETLCSSEIVDNTQEVKVEVINPVEVSTEKINSELLYILPSDTREINFNDLKDMDKEQLNRAYNEIFARHGHDFKTKSLKDYFKTQKWYKPIDGKTVTPEELSELENKNKDIIMSRIKEIEK